MAFFYVKAGGTRTSGGGDPSARTGPWSAVPGDYYDTLTTCIADASPPTAGDVICVSDASSDTIAGDTTVSLPMGAIVISVDDANQENYKKATTAQVSQGSGDDYILFSPSNSTNPNIIEGYNYAPGSNHYGVANVGHQKFIDVTYTNNSSTSATFFGSANLNARIEIINSSFGADSSHNGLYVQKGSIIGMIGGELGGNTRTINVGYQGGSIYLNGVDLSSSAATEVARADASGNAGGEAVIYGSRLPTGWTTLNFDYSPNRYVIVESCDSAYQFFKETHGGTVDFVTDVHYDDHDTLSDGVTKGSFEFDTNANAGVLSPLSLGETIRPLWLSGNNNEAASKKKVRLRFVTATGDTLDDADIEVHVLYPSNQSYQYALALHRRNSMESGSPLSTETGNWTGSGLGTQYYIDVDMGSPLNGNVLVMPAVCAADVTVYFSWQLEFVA